MKLSTSGLGQQDHEGGREGGDNKCLNSELWHACAGPLVSLPTPGTRVVYFPQGHSEQVAATTNKEVDRHMPNYPSLQAQLFCQLHNVTMHADVETDEVYAQLTLQPLTPQEQKDTFLPMEFGIPSRQPTNYFCKTLTASDTSTHGGFSVPRRAAEKVFPPLDFSQQPPAQELVARDLHDIEWKFRHIFRGQPKRHLLTTGWSVFVSAKRLVAGDSVLFIWNEKNQLLLGIRRANRPQTVMPSSVLTSDSMHIGLLAAAAHASSTNSCFTVFFNPRASPSEFVIPLSKYIKAVYQTRVSVGMRFRMLFETEESSVRRYMGTVTGISDLDSVRWPNSHWRSIKVGWDESTAGDKQPRVSLWEIEPLTTFPMYPSLFPLRMKRPWFPGASSMHENRDEGANSFMWLRSGMREQGLQSMNIPAVSMYPWMQQRVDATLNGSDHNQQLSAMLTGGFQNIESGDPSKQPPMMQYQPPFQYIQQSGSQTPQMQILQQPIHYNVAHSHSQVSSENMSQHLIPQEFNNQIEEQTQQQHDAYHNTFKIQNEQLDHRQPQTESSTSFPKAADILDSTTTSVTPRENILGSLYSEGSGNFLSLMRAGHSASSEQLPQESWAQKVAHPQINYFANSISLPQYPGKDTTMEPGSFSLNAQNSTQFGVNNRESSPLILPTTVSSFSTYLNDVGAPNMPLDDSGNQSLYNSVQDTSELLNGAGQIDPPTFTRNFVKVYKSGSVGRSLDISQFSSYHELREGLAQMFGIEGKLEDPVRSGWQLVFVDRENDSLLLGDDPWEAFVNNVWYIKILSPEDMHKMGEQSAGQRMHSNDNEVHELSGLPAFGSFEY